MSFFNSSEPLGLPPGSVRAIIALLINVTGMFLFATGAAISSEFIALLTLVNGAYFVARQTGSFDREVTPIVVEEKLEAPSIGDPV